MLNERFCKTFTIMSPLKIFDVYAHSGNRKSRLRTSIGCKCKILKPNVL